MKIDAKKIMKELDHPSKFICPVCSENLVSYKQYSEPLKTYGSMEISENFTFSCGFSVSRSLSQRRDIKPKFDLFQSKQIAFEVYTTCSNAMKVAMGLNCYGDEDE